MSLNHVIEKVDIMDAIECIKNRMSIRAFKPEKVPKDLLMEVVSISQNGARHIRIASRVVLRDVLD